MQPRPSVSHDTTEIVRVSYRAPVSAARFASDRMNTASELSGLQAHKTMTQNLSIGKARAQVIVHTALQSNN
jgi:hypothetical protein